MIGLVIFLLGMIIPVIMLLIGGVMSKEKSTEMSMTSGYRTKYSMLSKGTWNYANKLAGKMWVILGAVAAVLAVVMGIVVAKNDDIRLVKVILIMLAVQIVMMWLSYIPVEIMLRKKFDKEGNPRENV